MQLSPSRQHPKGGVVVECLHPINGGTHNRGEIVGFSVPPPADFDPAKPWTINEQIQAAQKFIESAKNVKDGSPGLRRWLPEVDRTKIELGQQMRHFDAMCRHVAKGDYDVDFAQGFVDSCLKKDVLSPGQGEWLKTKFADAKAARVVLEEQRKQRAAMGLTEPMAQGDHPLNATVTMQAAEIKDLKATVATLVAKVEELTKGKAK